MMVAAGIMANRSPLGLSISTNPLMSLDRIMAVAGVSEFITKPSINESNDDQHYGMIENTSHAVPWFYDLRPGAAILEKKMLQHHDTLGELAFDIHTIDDVAVAKALWSILEKREREG